MTLIVAGWLGKLNGRGRGESRASRLSYFRALLAGLRGGGAVPVVSIPACRWWIDSTADLEVGRNRYCGGLKGGWWGWSVGALKKEKCECYEGDEWNWSFVLHFIVAS